MTQHPGLRVEIQPTPDDATQRHQLYVQWLNAHASVLRISSSSTCLDAGVRGGRVDPSARPVLPTARQLLHGNRGGERLVGEALRDPWFVDVGLLYWRTDLLARGPASMEELAQLARQGMSAPGGARYGIVWQGARYEGWSPCSSSTSAGSAAGS
jgi:multiple sugar transport system substrate-binding protein